MSEYNVTIHVQGDLAHIAELEQYKREADAALEAVLKDKKRAEAELAKRDSRRCEDCADHGVEEPCDRFSDSFLTFMRDHCNDKPVSCCFWTARAEEGSET